MWNPFNFKKKIKSKIFCNECKYMLMQGSTAVCRNEYLSLNTYDRDTPLKRGTGELLTTSPQDCIKLNRDNNCFWFKPKEKK